jgi:signal transduction histidine kinase/ligand-binding sensor domain-containing protein/CheY-like chemotaxis protein
MEIAVEKKRTILETRPCRQKLLLLFLFSISISLAVSLQGQGYMVHHYSEPDGLASADVYDVVQDQDGRMWFATRAGISCYDGIDWKNYTVADGLPALSYNEIAVDKEGRVWALSFIHGSIFYVIYFDGTAWNRLAELSTKGLRLSRLTGFQLLEPPQKDKGEPRDALKTTVVIGTAKEGLMIWQNNKWSRLNAQNGLPDNNVTGIVTLGRKCYAATPKGLTIFEPGSPPENLSDRFRGFNPAAKPISSICVEHNNKYPGNTPERSRIWMLGEDWLGWFEKDSGFVTLYQDVPIDTGKNDHKIVLQPDYFGGLYAGTLFAIHYFNYKTGTWKSIGMANGLNSEGAHGFTVDFERNLWIADDRGVSKIASRKFGNFGKVNGLLEDEVTAVLEYEEGNFLLGHNKGVTFLEDGAFKPISFAEKISGWNALCRVLDMKVDHRKNVWLALAGSGLAKVDNRKQIKWYGSNSKLSKYISSLWIDKYERMWISTTDSLMIMDLKTELLKDVDVPVHASLIRKIFGTPDGLRYIVTFNSGLFEYDRKQKRWLHYKLPGRHNGNNVYAVEKDLTGRVWVGTLDGLYEADRVRIKLKKIAEGSLQIDRPVYFITRDRQQRIWFGTNDGVVRWDGPGEPVIKYSIAEGLVGQETNRAAGVVDSSGRFWIGTNRGLSIYDDQFDDLTGRNPPPKLRLMEMETNLRTIPLASHPDRTSPLQLKSGTHTLVFRLRGISFRDEKAVRFSYKLDGVDTGWIKEQKLFNQSVRYSNLHPGTYRFHVKAGNVSGVWSDRVTSPYIVIHTPFYKRWWFYLFIALSVVMFLYIILRAVTQQRHSALLEKQVKERTAQLQKIQQQLVQAQKMEAIGTLAGGIAHDFNNILGVIMGYSELVLEDLEEGSLVHQNARHILTASIRASELVKQILAFSRQSKRERIPLKIGPIIEESLKLMRSSLPATIEIRSYIRSRTAVIQADPTQIHQVLMNLCANASHAMRQGGGILEVHLDEVYLDDDAVKELHDIPTGQYVRLTVSDTGHGIPRVVMKRIFDPYFTTKDAGEGTGMGLAVIHGIVKSHAGDISVYSEPGKGTSFHVFLPRILENHTVEAAAKSGDTLPGGSEHILLVDDESALTEMGAQVLGRLGYSVTGKSDPLEAVEAFKRDPYQFQLVITDLTMPKMTGIRMAETIKEINPTVPVILCSGFSAAVPEEIIDSHVDDFVMKPVIKSELAQVVRDVLDRNAVRSSE